MVKGKWFIFISLVASISISSCRQYSAYVDQPPEQTGDGLRTAGLAEVAIDQALLLPLFCRREKERRGGE